MPLWTVVIRSLASRQASPTNIWRLYTHSSCILAPRAASYSIALHRSRPDDTALPPAILPSTDISDLKEAKELYQNAVADTLPSLRKYPSWRGRSQASFGRPKAEILAFKNFLKYRNRLWRAESRLESSRGAVYEISEADIIPEHQQTQDAIQTPTRRQRSKIATAQMITLLRDTDGIYTFPDTIPGISSTANVYTLAKTWPFHQDPAKTLRKRTYWEQQFAAISLFYATYRTRKFGEKPRAPRFIGPARKWAKFVIQKLDAGVDRITREHLRCTNVKHWRMCWEQIALWLLTYRPERMTGFLLATNTRARLWTQRVEDSFLQTARIFHYRKDTAQIQRLTDAFCTILERRPVISYAFYNEFVRILIRYSSLEQIKRLFGVLKTQDIKIHSHSWLHLTKFFANNNEFETAFDALLMAYHTGAKLDSYAFRSNCTTILRRSSEQPDGLRVCLRVISTLVDIGVTFNLPICNVIMLNAIEAGDLKTAFSVYHSLMERGLKPDEATFLVLLKGCRMNIDDAQLLDEIIRDAIGHLHLRQNPKVATEILHCLALHHSKHNPSTALHTLAEAYAQLFDLAPLRKLELPISPSLQNRATNEDPMPPSRHALTFMIGATIQHYLTTATATSPTAHTKDILDLYVRWRAHVTNDTGPADPLLASLATTDHVSNTFLSAFIRHKKTLLLAARIMRDLQRPLPPTAITTQTKPTVQTWSIFLHGFTQHDQMKLAEQVLTYMRKEGIEPNLVTWNTLLSGYARLQDQTNVVQTLRQLEREGMVWNVWTHRGLARLRQREKVDEEIRRRRVVEQLDFSSDLKQGLGERLEGPVSPGVVTGDERRPLDGFGDSAGEIAEQDLEDGEYRPFRPRI